MSLFKKGPKKPVNRLKKHLFWFGVLKGFIFFFALLLPMSWVYKVALCILLLYLFHLFSHRKFYKKNDCIFLFFGTPGSGKSTMAAALSHWANLRGDFVASNCDIKDTYRLDPSDLGHYSMYNGGKGMLVLLDEASLDFDSRDFKSFSSNSKKYFSLHRHECNEVAVFSQAVDIDKKIRDRAACCYYIQRSFLPWCIVYRRIAKMIDIDENTKQMVDGFKFVKLSKHVLFCPPYWRYFNTLDRSLCPSKNKNWRKWGEE